MYNVRFRKLNIRIYDSCTITIPTQYIDRIEVIRKSKKPINEARSPSKQPETTFAQYTNKSSGTGQIGNYSLPTGIRITPIESPTTTKKLGTKEIEVLKYSL